jgi:hypothetical protein
MRGVSGVVTTGGCVGGGRDRQQKLRAITSKGPRSIDAGRWGGRWSAGRRVVCKGRSGWVVVFEVGQGSGVRLMRQQRVAGMGY